MSHPEWFIHNPNVQTRWSSFENPTGAKGQAAKANRGWKGAASAPLAAGSAVALADVRGSGIIRRIWMTLSDRSPAMLRSLRLECFWDDAAAPAVSAPLGDFFGVGLGRMAAFESELFASPEGRSLVCLVPMPFRSAAKIVLTNESSADVAQLFYDVNYTLEPVSPQAMYFHAVFRRENPTTLGRDFVVLPTVSGRGRYLGANFGVIADSVYGGNWWGEGELKCFLDGDDFPTLCGTGTEDLVSTAYGQGAFSQRYHGSPIADGEHAQWAFYRYHIPDPVVFHTDCRVTLQQIGGAGRDDVAKLLERGAPIEPISSQTVGQFEPWRDQPSEDHLSRAPQTAWVNFLRRDDVSATAYFYLDKTDNGLPPLAPVAVRTAGLLQTQK